MVRYVLVGLCAVGIAPGDTVAIIGENSLPWLVADLATSPAAFPTGHLASLSDVMFARVLGHAGCRAAFVQDETTAGRLLSLQGQLPALQQLIVMDDSARLCPMRLTSISWSP
jgi:long-chain acyl-CoA synthetase